jgi:Enoyl-CoA hydratase/isomerase
VIESITKDGVAVLAMRHGKANALDTELCQALCGALDEATAEGAAAVVLTGAGPVFSAGVDLKRVIAGQEGYVAAFLPSCGVPLPALRPSSCPWWRRSTTTRSRAGLSWSPLRTGRSWPGARARPA